MDISSLTNAAVQTKVSTTAAKSTSTASDTTSTTAASAFSSDAVVYEKSSSAASTNKTTDYSAIVAQMKADSESRASQLTSMVKQMMTSQGKTIAQADDIWSFLASGDYTVDEAAKEKAQEAISEDGYWGVDKTSSRIVDFAIALSGNDTSKAETLIDAFKKGYEEATKSWGKDLPDISSKTYDAVLEKFDSWVNGTYESDTE